MVKITPLINVIYSSNFLVVNIMIIIDFKRNLYWQLNLGNKTNLKKIFVLRTLTKYNLY